MTVKKAFLVRPFAITGAILSSAGAFAQNAPAPPLRNGTLLPTPLAFPLPGDRKLIIGGFLQARFEASNGAILPEGGVGTGNGYNGNYNAGTNGTTFKIREARLYVLSDLSPRAKAIAEVSFAGAFNTTNGSNQVGVRRAYGQYTFGPNPAKGVTLTIGQFNNPFGYSLPAPRPYAYQPERPLAFNESASGLFANQEFDRGIGLEYVPAPVTLRIAVINGTGIVSNDVNKGKDFVAHGAYKFRATGNLSIGASAYLGTISAIENAGKLQARTVNSARKNLFGIDAQWESPKGPYIQAEYVGGEYEALAPFRLANPTATPPVADSDYLKGNKVEGYYVLGGWNFDRAKAHPWYLTAAFDSFKRRKSVGSYTDENLGFGGGYNLEKGVRARLYFILPSKVAHAPSAPSPSKLGLFTAELQFLL